MTVQSTSPRRTGRGRRAKPKRRAPVLAPILTAVSAVALAVAAHMTRAERPVLAAVVLTLQAAVGYGWLRTVGAPGRRGGLLVGVATGVAADGLLLVRGGTGTLLPVVVAFAFGFLASLLHQLARGDGRVEATASLGASVSGSALVVLTAVWLAVGRLGVHLLSASLAAVAAAALVDAATRLLPLPRVATLPVTVAVASGAGAAVGSVAPSFGMAYGAASGLAVGLFAAAAFVTAEYVRKLVDDGVVFAATVPLTVVAPAAYLAGRVLAG